MAENIVQQSLEEVFAERFKTYGSETVKERSIPAVEDGFLPVMRRIIYTMYKEGAYPRFTKAAQFVGTTIGRYHPHGDSSCYESMVGMSQGFRKLNPLIDPQGNNGSVDDFKSFAAMRYLELRLSAYTRDVFFSNFSEKNNNFVPNYDKTHLEPEVFTPVIPTILNNGITAIASGFVCNLPTHRVKDIVEVTKRLIADADISDKELAKGFYPDFPLGATIINRDDLIDMYTRGQGVIQVQATLEDSEFKGKPAIIVRNLPPEVSANKILEQVRIGLTPEDVKQKGKKKNSLTKQGILVDLIQDVKDISTKDEGIGIALLLKKGVDSGTVKNILYKSTSLRYSVKYQANVLIEGRLESNCSLKKLLNAWVAFRRNTVRRILNIKIADYSEQQSLKQALIKALGKIDQVIEIVQNAADKKEAIDRIRKLLKIGLNQATYIVETKLYQLSKMSVQDLKDEIKTLGEKIKEAVETISDDHRIDEIIVEEMDRIVEKHCKKEKRTTDVINITSSLDDVKAFVQPENLVIGFAKEMDDLEHAGYSSNAYVFAKSTDEIISGDTRGRKGQNFVPSTVKKVIIETFTVNTHDYILCFTTDGKLIIRQGYEFNMWNKPIGAILSLEGRRISTIIPITEKDLDKYLVFVTEAGYMKRIPVDSFDLNRKAAVIAIKPTEGDILKAVSLSLSEIDNVFVYSNEGKAQRLLASQIDEMTRASAGRCRLTLGEDEYVVGLTVGNTDTTKILMCASNGKGKIIDLEEFPLRRGDKGRRSMLKAITLAEGEMLIGALIVKEEDSVAFNTSNNKIVSLNVANVTTLGRNAKGMTLAKPSEGEIITSITYSN
jgi:DNA gyrase subunit A